MARSVPVTSLLDSARLWHYCMHQKICETVQSLLRTIIFVSGAPSERAIPTTIFNTNPQKLGILGDNNMRSLFNATGEVYCQKHWTLGHSWWPERSLERLPGPARGPRVSLMTPRQVLRNFKKSKNHDFS